MKKTRRPKKVLTQRIPVLDPKAIGLRISRTRKRRGWRQLDLAEVSGVHPSVIGAIEVGNSVPTIRSGLAICVALKRGLHFIFFGLPRGGKLWKLVDEDKVSTRVEDSAATE